jgi:hypothetical protein
VMSACVIKNDANEQSPRQDVTASASGVRPPP